MQTPLTRALPRGARLDAFEIVEAIAEGSSSIVYRATPLAGGAAVALMEYMPARLAQRDAAGAVAARSPALGPAYRQGLAAFLDEARTLMRCDHPALVRVLQVREVAGTAYRCMPLVEGRRLSELRSGMAEPPGEDVLRGLLDGLLGALETWHREGGLHGSVTAANILLLADDRPLLLGPGGAGRAIAAERIASLMTSEEPCFAPVEQIVPTADMPLGPAADLYALAGVLRYLITGQLPPPALGLPGAAHREPLRDVAQRLRKKRPNLTYSAALLDTLEAALSTRPAERPQSVAQFRAWLAAGPPGSVAAAGPVAGEAVPAAPQLWHDPAPPPAPIRESRGRRHVWLWGSFAILLMLVILGFTAKRQLDLRRESARTTETTASVDAAVGTPQAPPAPAVQPGRAATSPREVCDGRTTFAFNRCMKSRCAQAQWKSHAECERLRRTDRID